MLKIRLQRTGKRGQAYFKVVVTEHTIKPQGKYLELLGSYDPHKNEITVNAEKVKYWIGQGAHMSETLNNLLVGRSIIEGKKVQVWKPKPSSRAQAEGKKKGGEAPSETKAAEAPVVKAPEEVKEEAKTEEPVLVPNETPAAVSP